MEQKQHNQHVFALYYEATSLLNDVQEVTMRDAGLYHRLVSVLRFAVGERCILFDKHYQAEVELKAIQKKAFIIHVHYVTKNVVFKPHIQVLLPLLKRQSLVEAVYMAVETGVSSIQLITTDKVQRAWGDDKEFERLQAVIIAACEQSKNFDIPDLYEPLPLKKVITAVPQQAVRISFDAEGQSCRSFFSAIDQPEKIIMLIGPEGDLTAAEKHLVQQAGFIATKLTPTILRSTDAVAVSIGMLRSFLHNIFL